MATDPLYNDALKGQLQDPDTQALLAQLAQLLSASGAGGMMGFGGGAQGGPQAGGNLFQQPNSPPIGQVNPVGGPGEPPIADNYAPRGTIFLGGSPFKPNFGPARLQNSLVLMENLLNSSQKFSGSPMGQALGEKLKNLFGSK